MRCKPLRFVAPCLTAALLLLGCYGSTRPVVKIGLIAPFEALYREDGYAVLHAVRLAVAEANQAGGAGGYDLELVALNDDGNPAEAAIQALKMGLDPRVFGVIGPVQLATVRAAGPVLAQQGLPWITLVPLEPAERPGGFSLSASPTALTVEGLDHLESMTVEGTIAVFSDQASALEAASAWAKVMEWPVEFRSPHGPLSVDQAVQGVFWLGDAAGAARLVESWADRPGSPVQIPLVGGPGLESSIFLSRTGLSGEGVDWLSTGPPLAQLPPQFVDAYQQLAGRLPGPQAVLAYDAASLLIDAIERAARSNPLPGRQDVLQAIQALGIEGWAGLAGWVQWGQDGVWQDAPINGYQAGASLRF